jgi:hypothetical protein
MGKVGRFACILTPMLLTLASLITFIIVVMGQMPWKGNNAPVTALGRDLYFFKVRLRPNQSVARNTNPLYRPTQVT